MSRRRADQAMPNLWEFPGGKVEPGEHPEAALVREVREELGCDIEVGRIHEVVFHAYPDFDLVHAGLRERDHGAVTPRAVEVAEVAWVEAAAAPGAGSAARRLPAGARAGRAGDSGRIARGFGAERLRARRRRFGWRPRPRASAALAAACGGRLGCAWRSASRSALRAASIASRLQAPHIAGSAQAPRCVCSWLSGGQ